MTVRSQGRIPGPLGIGSSRGAAPTASNGPLGLWRGAVFAAPKSLKAGQPAVTVKLPMSPPAGDNKTKELKDVDWKLYPKKKPHWQDVKQSDVLMGCALASVLGALSNTATGDKHIMRMIREVAGGKGQTPVTVEVSVKKVLADLSDDARSALGSTKKITTNRYFSVKIGGKSLKVSSVFYTDESSNVILIYMGSPNNALWPCVIEKAYAKYLDKGGYAVFENFADPEVVWKDIVGTKPQRLQLARAKAKDIYAVARNASRIPTIATTSVHGYTVLGLSHRKIRLRDPWTDSTSMLDLKSFLASYTDMFHGAP